MGATCAPFSVKMYKNMDIVVEYAKRFNPGRALRSGA
jgi:hypothetical protein